MSETYNIYCDESCHLENDSQKVMVLGAIWCPFDKIRQISYQIRAIKKNHNLNPYFEIKWKKVSKGKIKFYIDLLDYFFNEDDLHFRALIVPDKSKLRHEEYGQTHDDWYYKMYFDMLKIILDPKNCYQIYLDIKDTHGRAKVKKLHDVLCHNIYDFSRDIIRKVQVIRSEEFEILQLTDLLIGIVSYVNRDLSSNEAKKALVERMRMRSGYSLTLTTLLRENKVNLFHWHS
jgi:hypothetical protein